MQLRGSLSRTNNKLLFFARRERAASKSELSHLIFN